MSDTENHNSENEEYSSGDEFNLEDDYNEDDDDDFLFQGIDINANDDKEEDYAKEKLSEEELALIGNSNSGAVMKIMKDYKQIINSSEKEYFNVEVDDYNVHHWNLEMTFPKDEEIQKQLHKFHQQNKDHPPAIKMTVSFPGDYPFRPPFVRVISPRFQQRTGRITIGGSICMELLTSGGENGWVPTYSFGTALVQIQSEIMSGNPQVDFYNKQPYNEHEAKEAFLRVARTYGWEK